MSKVTKINEPIIISISVKCSDRFWCQVQGQGYDFDYEGYVPDFMPDQHYGDYVMLDIDIKTGKIVNWNKVTKADLNKLKKAV